ncbi:hypothetical protein CEE36_05930 [candidate division TA06 bacterium B3_TA06]|uniref:DUF5683 domain-containing protein n=1 Tax=candidate division TA06 bacterium B3_TA06 TaxID=2012487 RepID=A0A532V7A2_UNCT6|nr:MAG: hypothetical protein CEE36_05930 [candidate division TA06 bacterium B3_TA06]
MRGLALLAVLFSGFLLTLAAEETTSSPPESNAQDSLKTPADTAITSPKGEMERKNQVRTAMLLSAFIPGAGQLYNESYAKGGLIAAAEIALACFTVREHLLMIGVDEMWSDDVPSSVKGPRIDSLRNLHQDRRNVFAFFTGAVIAFAVSDAYVDAHMFRFKEQQRLSLVPAEQGIGLALRYRF